MSHGLESRIKFRVTVPLVNVVQSRDSPGMHNSIFLYPLCTLVYSMLFTQMFPFPAPAQAVSPSLVFQIYLENFLNF